MLDAPILADAQENDAVYCPLDGKVQFSLAEVRISQGDVSGKALPPDLDFLKERGIHLRRAFLAFRGLRVPVKGTLENLFTRENRGNLVPALWVFGERDVEGAGCRSLIRSLRLDAAVVRGEFLEIGENAQGQFRGPGVPAELIGGVNGVLDADGGFLRFDEEFPRAADAEAVVGRLRRAPDFDGVFVDDVLVSLGVPTSVVNVPAEGVEEWVYELQPELRFLVPARAIVVKVAFEPLDKLSNFTGSCHLFPSFRWAYYTTNGRSIEKKDQQKDARCSPIQIVGPGLRIDATGPG
ncbi:MAG: hypothetical protein Q8Q12_15680 [bacterium]|nr:hypothetical protein [bacterium]